MKRRLITIALAAGMAATLNGQTKSDPNPKLGLQASGVYALSDIETISQTNGNLTVNIPLGSLGPNRVGGTPTVVLGYNSKIWEPTAGTAQVAGQDYLVSQVQPANQLDGGWRYQVAYDLEETFRPQDIDCTNFPAETRYNAKLRMVFPDGSKHLLRLVGQSDNGGDGYYEYNPDGTFSAPCTRSQGPLHAALIYYTTDGTYARLMQS